MWDFFGLVREVHAVSLFAIARISKNPDISSIHPEEKALFDRTAVAGGRQYKWEYLKVPKTSVKMPRDAVIFRNLAHGRFWDSHLATRGPCRNEPKVERVILARCFLDIMLFVLSRRLIAIIYEIDYDRLTLSYFLVMPFFAPGF